MVLKVWSPSSRTQTLGVGPKNLCFGKSPVSLLLPEVARVLGRATLSLKKRLECKGYRKDQFRPLQLLWAEGRKFGSKFGISN